MIKAMLWTLVLAGWMVWFSVADAGGKWILILPGIVILAGFAGAVVEIIRSSVTTARTETTAGCGPNPSRSAGGARVGADVTLNQSSGKSQSSNRRAKT